MVEYYYTLILIITLVGMVVCSRSIPVALVSLYIIYWFLPQGIELSGINVSFVSVLALGDLCYLLYYYFKQRNVLSKDINLYRESASFTISLVLFFLLIAVTSTSVPLNSQMISLKTFIYYSLTIIIASTCIKERNEFLSIFFFVIFLVILSGIYGVYTYIERFNPLESLLVSYNPDLFDGQGLGEGTLDTERGFLHGRITGFTIHPLLYGGVLVLCFYYIVLCYDCIKNKLGKLFVGLVLLFCFSLTILTGSRSILIGLFAGVFYYLFKKFPTEVLKYGFLVVTLFLIFGMSIEDEFIRSTLFFWEENEEIKGSSTSMRFDQLEAVSDAVSGDVMSFLFGFGRGWSTEYVMKYGNIPPFQGFESFFFASIVEFGFLGTIIYVYLVFYRLFKINSNYVIDLESKYLVNAFLLSGFTIYTFTGWAYGYWLYIVLAFLAMNYLITKSSFTSKSQTEISSDEDTIHCP